ncbi:13353_t:CDS:10 [Acaulospora morrowiae]|uniref:13353_t:CDS:1 n=1 Tax=Acaulospora morrowiae TaxID=94023 RepID=A0A9N9AHV6_9GLOM|nr:13353_t:CDS:10 [Acaulospora morrowiae]
MTFSRFGTSTSSNTGFGGFGTSSASSNTGFGGSMAFSRFGTSTSNTGFGGFTAKTTPNAAFGFNNFGNTPSGFGATPSGGLFSGNPAGGGGFNVTSTASAFGNTSGSGGFGGFGNNQPAGGTPFGSSTTSSFGGFASNNSAAPGFGFPANQASAAPFGIGFGQTSTTNAGNFGFGGGAQTSQPSGFGQITSQQMSKPLGFGLGASTQSSFFGIGSTTQTSMALNPFKPGTQQPTQNAFGNLFNSTMQPSAPTMVSNVGLTNPSTQTMTLQQQSNQQQITPYEELARIINSWDPNSPDCKFQSYFYNMVHPDEVQFYTPPSNMPQNLWIEAQSNNPDRTILVPVRVCGFEDIKKRIEVQEEITAKAVAKFKEYGAKLEEMERKHSLETLVRIEERKRKHIELTQRVIKLMRQIQVLRLKGTLIRADEETLKGRLEDIKQRTQRPLRKLETLKTQYNVTKVQWGSRESPVIHKFNAVDENQLENITKVLGAEHTGIVHDIETLKKDSKDIDIIIRSFNGVPDTIS